MTPVLAGPEICWGGAEICYWKGQLDNIETIELADLLGNTH